MMKRGFWLAGLLVLACATVKQYQGVTASHTGCPPDEITISDKTPNSWTADCRGKRYYCSIVGSKGATVTCTPEKDAPAAAEAAK